MGRENSNQSEEEEEEEEEKEEEEEEKKKAYNDIKFGTFMCRFQVTVTARQAQERKGYGKNGLMKNK